MTDSAATITLYKGDFDQLTARIAALEAELAKRDSFLREALPHLHHTGATHHEQCACSVKRRIEAAVKP